MAKRERESKTHLHNLHLFFYCVHLDASLMLIWTLTEFLSKLFLHSQMHHTWDSNWSQHAGWKANIRTKISWNVVGNIIGTMIESLKYGYTVCYTVAPWKFMGFHGSRIENQSRWSDTYIFNSVSKSVNCSKNEICTKFAFVFFKIWVGLMNLLWIYVYI